MAGQVSRGRQIFRLAMCTVVGFMGATWLFTHTDLGPRMLGIQVNLNEPISPIELNEKGRPGAYRFSLLSDGANPVHSIHINGLGQSFLYQGAMMRVSLYTPDGKLIAKDLEGLVDTGADFTHVAQKVMDTSGLKPLRDTVTYAGASGKEVPSKFYQTTMELFNGQKIPMVISTFTEAHKTSYDILIGRDLLSMGTLTYDGVHGWATLKFERSDPPKWPDPQLYPPPQ